MSIDIRKPNITATSTDGQLTQVKSYLVQLSEQLQWLLNTDVTKGGMVVVQPTTQNTTTDQSSSELSVSDAQKAFSYLKPLIIKSADIVNAYYEKIDELINLSGEYVASSDFGEYTKTTNQTISANSDDITQHLERIEKVESNVSTISSAIKHQNSYIKSGAVGTTLDESGLATESAPGIEIGDFITLSDGVTTEVNTRYARFTAYGLELFGDDLTRPVAYIKQNKLYITNIEVINIEIKGNVRTGGFVTDCSDGIAIRWEGVVL